MKINEPPILHEMFWSVLKLSVQGFGGMLPLMYRLIVIEKSWLASNEFADMWSIAQLLPGPNQINFVILFGFQKHGIRGSVVLLVSILILPLIVTLLILAMSRFVVSPHLQEGVINGMGAVSSGLIGGTGLKMLLSERSSFTVRSLSVLTVISVVVVVVWYGWSIWAALLFFSPFSIFLAYRNIKGCGR